MNRVRIGRCYLLGKVLVRVVKRLRWPLVVICSEGRGLRTVLECALERTKDD